MIYRAHESTSSSRSLLHFANRALCDHEYGTAAVAYFDFLVQNPHSARVAQFNLEATRRLYRHRHGIRSDVSLHVGIIVDPLADLPPESMCWPDAVWTRASARTHISDAPDLLGEAAGLDDQIAQHLRFALSHPVDLIWLLSDEQQDLLLALTWKQAWGARIVNGHGVEVIGITADTTRSETSRSVSPTEEVPWDTLRAALTEPSAANGALAAALTWYLNRSTVELIARFLSAAETDPIPFAPGPILLPLNELEAKEGHRRWFATGSDPQFAVAERGGTCNEPGWYRIEFKIEAGLGQQLAQLYVDHGSGVSSENVHEFRYVSLESVERVFHLTRPVHAWRFDPVSAAGPVVLHQFVLIRCDPADAAARIAKRLSERHRRYIDSDSAVLYSKLSPLFERLSADNAQVLNDYNASFDSRFPPRPDDFADLIIESNIFDPVWYADKYQLGNRSDALALQHFLEIGIFLDHDPSAAFETRYYLTVNPDVAAANIFPIEHYLRTGKAEGRDPRRPDIFTTSAAQENLDREFVPYVAPVPAVMAKPARIICFYLPQFHAIPQNDAWWGTGFTEWTNVKPARPQFEGHYQPHVPEQELGHYDLLNPEIQRKQVQLAKDYGIEGFCFYFYWFGGNRLLEKPVENYLADKNLDLPFCLCWANENWSRRWDGLENEILIGQSHSEADDLAFIEEVAKYMRDPRYIRIDGKPVLLLYRPGLLPDVRATAQRWRQWCRSTGIGEIHLAYPQSFEAVDPETFGFDAAIEFPPNNTAPPLITEVIPDVHQEFTGKIYDWRVFPQRSRNYTQPAYRLYRGACPAWDNTARRKRDGTILYGSSPRGYQEWLVNAILDTARRFSDENERFIFVNAWNEWAEGAHLEPDARHGYANLEAGRLALLRADIALNQGRKRNASLAIIIHAFYPDVLAEIMEYLNPLVDLRLNLYVTCPEQHADAVRRVLSGGVHEYLMLITENRGRDVAPFFQIFDRVAAGGHELLLKLHTKKSKHRGDGTQWRKQLFDALLNPEAVRQTMQTFDTVPSLGMAGPPGHVLPMSAYWGSNERQVLRLATRMGIDRDTVLSASFVAGTMFFARVDAVRPLRSIVDFNLFENEAGQTDGTLAHAIERAFSISTIAAGLRVASLDRPTGEIVHASHYQFADSTGGTSEISRL